MFFGVVPLSLNMPFFSCQLPAEWFTGMEGVMAIETLREYKCCRSDIVGIGIRRLGEVTQMRAVPNDTTMSMLLPGFLVPIPCG